ncbi:unnamed protein product, partial [Rotaria socialis]
VLQDNQHDAFWKQQQQQQQETYILVFRKDPLIISVPIDKLFGREFYFEQNCINTSVMELVHVFLEPNRAG